MTRVPVSVLAGTAMSLLLFWLLALLVSPPEPEIEVLEMSMPLTSVEAPDVEPEAAEVPAEAAPPAPSKPVVPPPLPEPAPIAESHMALPEPALPPEAVEPMELDSKLPEFSEERPEPVPEPQPEPEPVPEPQPAPDPRPDASSSEKEAQSTESSSAAPASSEPVDVGQAAPTERVPPAYPTRAQRRGLEGHVELEFVIRADGSVDPASVRVLSARPRNVFDDAARQAVAQWRFAPGEGLRRARQRLEFQLR